MAVTVRFDVFRDNSVTESTYFVAARAFAEAAESCSVTAEGYSFLSTLDHNLRLTVGRTTRVPLGNENALTTIAARMGLTNAADLLEQLTLHRLNIREAFDTILAEP